VRSCGHYHGPAAAGAAAITATATVAGAAALGFSSIIQGQTKQSNDSTVKAQEDRKNFLKVEVERWLMENYVGSMTDLDNKNKGLLEKFLGKLEASDKGLGVVIPTDDKEAFASLNKVIDSATNAMMNTPKVQGAKTEVEEEIKRKAAEEAGKTSVHQHLVDKTTEAAKEQINATFQAAKEAATGAATKAATEGFSNLMKGLFRKGGGKTLRKKINKTFRKRKNHKFGTIHKKKLYKRKTLHNSQ